MIEFSNVSKTYKGIAGSVPALIDVNLKIAKGERLAIVGKSGSGKSTLLNILSGIDRSELGTLVINGSNISQLNESELALWRGKNVGIVFQSYQLIPSLSVLDNILYPMDLVKVIPKADRKTRAIKLLANVGLEDKMKKFPNELSGGEAQRVAIARALANDPDVILADEPTGNLDTDTGEQIYRLFEQLNKEGKTVITVTHDQANIRHFSRVIKMKDGRIVNQ